MRLVSGLTPAVFLIGFSLTVLPACGFAQETGINRNMVAAAEMPDAPQPQFSVAAAEPYPQATASQTQNTTTSSQTSPPQGSSSSQTVEPPAAAETQKQKADEQIKEQEKQRVLGIVPSFNISYRPDAVSLSGKQKISLAFHSATDPVAFAVALVAAGYHEVGDDDIGFGWGAEGYGKRAGAAYLDAFDGAMIGNGILPAIFHQDPRYFRRGHGSFGSRVLFALATNVVCKHDNTGKWEPNYSNVGGNIISGAISNLYYPSDGSGISQTFSNGMLVTAEGGFGSLFQEFWPDVSRKLFHKDPTRGLDAQYQAEHAADKKAKDDAKAKAKQDQK